MTFTAFVLFMSFAAQAAPLPPEVRPTGEYVFRDHYQIPKVRRAVKVDLKESGAQGEIREYKSKGFSCIKNSPSAVLCSKMEKPETLPAEVDQAILKGMASMAISFPGPVVKPTLAFDGSQTEWLYREPVSVRGVNVPMFKLVTYPISPEGTRPVPQILFPVSEEQGIPYADFPTEDELVIHFILSTSEGKVKSGYFVQALLEH